MTNKYLGRLFSVILAIAMCSSLCIPSLAADGTQGDTTEDTSISAYATIENPDGTIDTVPVEISTKVVCLPMMVSVLLSAQSENKPTYATTIVAKFPISTDNYEVLGEGKKKSDSDSKNEYYVTAYGTIYWRDNWGSKNEFLGASGGWDPDINPNTGKYPKLSDRLVSIIGQSNARDREFKEFRPTRNTFEISASDFTFVRSVYRLDTHVTVDGHRLSFFVENSPFT